GRTDEHPHAARPGIRRACRRSRRVGRRRPAPAGHDRMSVRRLLLLAGLALLLAAPAARADGDPASDVLYTQRLFIPFNAPISTSVASELDLLIAAANRSGYPLKVAL